MKTKDTAFEILFMLCGAGIIIYIGILFAPCLTDEGLFVFLDNAAEACRQPFNLKICVDTFKLVMILLSLGFIAALYIKTNQRNTRNGEEHGSAKWADVKAVCKLIGDKEYMKNRILTQNLRLSIIGKKIKLSLNTLVIGGMGAGKSFFILLPNLLQGNTSFMVADPSKELIRSTGWFLKHIFGYEVKVFDVEDPSTSMKYNFFKYIKTEDDILRIVDIIFKSTVTNKKATNTDPMWENMAKDYLQALVALLWYRGTASEQNIENIIWLMNQDFMEEDEDGNRIKTPIMALFEDLDNRMPGNLASSSYSSATDGAVATIRGVKSTLRGRIGKFLLPSIQRLMSEDELELEQLGLRKTALFLVVPSEDTSFNFLVSMLYAQAIPLLYKNARAQPDNKLPCPMQIMMDEMANFCLPDDFITYLTTGRKHLISFMMFIQEIAQLEKMFPEKQFQVLVGTCNTLVYLGGSGNKTNEEISKWMGNETISVYSYNRSYGRNESYTKNENRTQRALLTPDEIDTKLGDDRALVYVKGQGWLFDNKNNPMRHPNYKYVASESGHVYDWSGKELIRNSLGFVSNVTDEDNLLTINLDDLDLQKLEKQFDIKIA